MKFITNAILSIILNLDRKCKYEHFGSGSKVQFGTWKAPFDDDILNNSEPADWSALNFFECELLV